MIFLLWNIFLIIEDEKDVNRLLAQILQDSGYETVSIWNGIAGTDICRKEYFALILPDLMLPYKSGDEVLKEI